MKLGILQIDDTALIAIVDAKKSVFWPISARVPEFNGDMVQLVQSFSKIRGDLRPRGEGWPLGDATVLAPIDQPRRNIFCVGKNYHDHAA
jgi:2-keto-4-pentenoate hydratase/2-oxohepta-3-ene-1,7-dioic acid hydratase in catechol pathway